MKRLSLSFPANWPLSANQLLRFGLATLMISLGVFFVHHEGPELRQAVGMLGHTSLLLAQVALLVTGLYILFSAWMYVESFAATNGRIPLSTAVRLWLRRNFISVFLPAGGVSRWRFTTGRCVGLV